MSTPKALWTISEAKKLVKKSSHSVIGGLIEDLPLPHFRRFDDKRKRRELRVSVTRFGPDGFGIGPDALEGGHIYVSLREEDNPILRLCPYLAGHTSPCWQICHDDTEGKGRFLSKRCNSESDAAHYLAVIFTKEFSLKTHKIVNEFEEWGDLQSGKIVRRAIKLINERSAQLR